MANSADDGVNLDSDGDAVVIDHDDISNYNPDQVLPESEETIQKIRDWLQATPYDIAGGEYRKHLASHVAGTGTWLTSSTEYQQWLADDQKGLLWIKGIPGSGKSVMAANLVNELAQANPGSPVLFFFFRQIIQANHTPDALLRDWMDQILAYSPPLQKKLKSDSKSRSIASVSMDEMWKNLYLAFSGVSGRGFCVADALDEIDQGNDVFLKALASLGRWRPSKVKVLITSRPVPTVEGPLRNSPCHHIRLDENLVDVDIATYVRTTLSKSTIPKSDWQVIADAVPGKANGLFLYAKLAMESFLEPGVDISLVLSRLPADLNVLYTRLLEEHSRRSGVADSIQRLILQAVTHARRPLRLLELAEMIMINNSDDAKRDLKATKDLIRAGCGPLLEILADETVSVIHHSFTEYLKGTTRSHGTLGYPILEMGPSHTCLGLLCLYYLSRGNIESPVIEHNDRGGAWFNWPYDVNKLTKGEIDLRLKHPFFDYAANNWAYHIKESETAGENQSEVNHKIRQFLGDEKLVEVWMQTKWLASKVGATQVHMAARFGLLSYLQELVQTMAPDEPDHSRRTPLWWAAHMGHADIVRELIKLGADPDHGELEYGSKPLHEAAKRNHPKVITVLLEAGVDPFTREAREDHRMRPLGTTIVQNALGHACKNGHLESVEVFLPFIQTMERFQEALSLAAENGRSKVVSRMLRVPGIDANDCQVLYFACRSGDIETIECVLNAGADPNLGFPSPRGRNVLQVLSAGRNWGSFDNVTAIFPLLIQAGFDIHQRDSSGKTPLHHAADSPVLTRLLLQAGADANATDNQGATPVHYVSNTQCLALFIEEGHGDINIAQVDGKTALNLILNSYEENGIAKLLEYSPYLNVTDGDGNGIMHLALERGNPGKDLIQALLEAGADPNLKNKSGKTPLLYAACSEMKEDVINLLIGAGADINATDNDGKNALFSQFYGHRYPGQDVDGIPAWIKRGVSKTGRDRKGRTLLHEAVWTYGHRRDCGNRLDFFFGLGFDIHGIDDDGNGLLHELAKIHLNHVEDQSDYLIPYWEQVVGLGLDLDKGNYDGLTPLHILCSAAHPEQSSKAGVVTPIDWVMERMKNIDSPDKHGITPLHRAVTIGELYTQKLLEAGANPRLATHEGLTPLHLASRSRQSNVVGMLLQALRKLTPSSNQPALGVDAVVSEMGGGYQSDRLRSLDSYSATPLFYACRSGRPETVALLLDAGADIKKCKVLHACAGFEDEEEKWDSLPKVNRGEQTQVRLMIDDEISISQLKRPFDHEKLKLGKTTRLEEILDLLVKHGLDSTDVSRLETRDQADDRVTWIGFSPPQYIHRDESSSYIDMAFAKQRDYTGTCFREATQDRIRVDLTQEGKCDPLMSLAERLHRSSRSSAVEALRSSGLIQPGESHRDIFLSFLRRREYRLVEEMARLGAEFLPNSLDRESNFSLLVQNGYFSLAEKIGTIVTERELSRGNWHAFNDNARAGLWLANRDLTGSLNDDESYLLPFLSMAVARELPNMEMVKLLIERFGVNLNELVSIDKTGTETYKGTALHTVSLGRHWWQVHQALPYLLQSGADIDLCDSRGRTALHVALEGHVYLGLPFRIEAARQLVEAGADVDAIDLSGVDCLAYAGGNLEAIQLLISHGASVTPESIFKAIDVNSASTLQVLLSSGTSANIRRMVPQKHVLESRRKELDRMIRKGMFNSISVEDHEIFPLYYAGCKLDEVSSGETPQSRREAEACFQLVHELLQHGADMFAKFVVPSPVTYGAAPENFRQATVLHELLYSGKRIDPFLHIPQLDVNRRDARGCTLLLAACLGGPDIVLTWSKLEDNAEEKSTTFRKLLSLGAVLEDRDNAGQNALHLMLGRDLTRRYKCLEKIQNSLAETIRQAPCLINQKDDSENNPLHLAARLMVELSYGRVTSDPAAPAEMLISAGADYLTVDGEGNSILHLIAAGLDEKYCQEFFERMVQRGMDVNRRNARGETPVLLFCRNTQTRKPALAERRERYNKVISKFKRLGADLFVTENKGQGLLHVAAAGDEDLFKELMSYGLDTMLEDNAQQTPIDMAAAHGNRNILKIFEKTI